MIYVGSARVSLEKRAVFRNGELLTLGGRAFDILAMLIRSNGNVVSKRELIREVWNDTVVEENNLQVQISALRKLLGDKSLIQTIPRRGYRLLTSKSPATPAPLRQQPPAPGPALAQEEDAGVVYIVDDDAHVRTALSRLLRSHAIAHQTFGSAEEFLAAQLGTGSACLLLDVTLPAATGFDLQAELAQRSRHWPIVFMTGHGSIPMSVQAMKAGAVEFLTKPFDEQTLISTLTHVLAIAQAERRKWLQVEGVRRQYATLTPREREVLELLVTGIANKEVARQLGTSEVTVKVHKKHVMDKMQASTVVGLLEKYRLLHPAPSEAGAP